jgi:hypothetical protein
MSDLSFTGGAAVWASCICRALTSQGKQLVLIYYASHTYRDLLRLERKTNKFLISSFLHSL